MAGSFQALRGLTLPGVLERQVMDGGDRMAIVDGSVRLTFSELDDLSDRLASALLSRGIGGGDVVSCQLPNVWEYVCLLLATSKIGAVFNAQHMVSRVHELEYALGFSESKAFFFIPEYAGFDFRAMLASLERKLPHLRLPVAVRGRNLPGEASFEAFLGQSRSSDLPGRRPQPDDPFILTYTSGTSGTPKGVLHSHDAPLSNTQNLTELLEMTRDNVLLSASAYSFAYGTYTILIGLTAGAKQILLESFQPEGFFEAVEKEGVTHVYGVPAIASALVKHPGASAADFSSLEQFMLAGAPHPPALVYQMSERFQCTPIMLWGMTETYRGTVTRPGDDLDVIANTVGTFHPGWEMKIVSENGREVAAGSPGELVIRGPWLFREYIKNPASMSESFTPDGFFKTGDEAVIDSHDRVRITGRIKDLIKRGGVPVSPKEIEDIAFTHAGIRECALVAMPDERLGEKSCLFVVKEPGRSLDLADICQLLEQKGVAKYKWPERLEFIDQMPLNAARKVRKNLLREEIARQLELESRGHDREDALPRKTE